jgi:hypothetical protein
MKQDRKPHAEEELTDEELEVFGDFADAQRDGKNPDIEEYMRRCPGSSTRLRYSLESVQAVYPIMAQYKRAHPELTLEKFLADIRKAKARKR